MKLNVLCLCCALNTTQCAFGMFGGRPESGGARTRECCVPNSLNDKTREIELGLYNLYRSAPTHDDNEEHTNGIIRENKDLDCDNRSH